MPVENVDRTWNRFKPGAHWAPGSNLRVRGKEDAFKYQPNKRYKLWKKEIYMWKIRKRETDKRKKIIHSDQTSSLINQGPKGDLGLQGSRAPGIRPKLKTQGSKTENSGL